MAVGGPKQLVCTCFFVSQRKILHIDCDCFYAAVEMRDNPRLRGRPLAVGGQPGQRGVIATCNYEARAYGVRSAMASAQALKKCPSLLILPGRMSHYREVSAQIRTIFERYSDRIEPLSLDEAYLDVSDSPHCRGSATRIAEQIRQSVRDEVGITVSAGVAPNKFLAKIASDWNKPDGLFVIQPVEVDQFVAALPVRKLAGVGPATQSKLQRWNIETCADLRRFSLEALVAMLGSFGERLYQLSRGVDDRDVIPERVRKSLSVEQTYNEDLPDYPACEAVLPELMADFQRRQARLEGRYRIVAAQVKVKFDDFVQTTIERRASGVDLELFQLLLAEGWARGKRPVRLLGIGVRLEEGNAPLHQLTLF